MDRRRAAGALLALAVCITSSDAAPTASNQTTLDLYDGAAEGCYYNFQHYGEGDRIMTNEPCLNCTCHNRMLMCYLRVCPFTKAIGQDCTVEKRADQCCPIVTCPDVPVDLLTSTSTNSPAEYGATGVGKLDKYGCNINGKYFPEGSKVPPNPNNSCEHCYCIRNMTTCVMQECTLHVDGCTPIYHKAVCCPVRYSCDHPEDEMLLLDDMTTTVRPTPGFLLTTTTLSPVTQMSQDCVHEDKIVSDGALIKTEKACEHCYCMKGDIVCVVQECGTPMENEGKNCTSQPPREGQCCPDTYICEGDEIATELASVITTEPTILEEISTLSPPRRIGVEGSGYRKESEESYTEVTPFETDTEGSGYDNEIGPIIDTSDTDEKQTPEITSDTTEDILYITTSAKTPSLEEIEKTTEPDKGLNTVPSGLFDEESHDTSMTQRTTISEEIHLTEPTIVTEDKKDEIEDKTIVPEITSSEMIHKHDEILTTTESTIITEDKKDEFEDKTIIPEITSSEMIDKHDEILTPTEPTIITEDKKDEFEDKTMGPEINASEMIDKHDEILTTTEPTVRIEDENNEITDMAGHTEGDKMSTTQNQLTDSSTPQSEHDISEIETKVPSIDESEVKVTTDVYTTKYELPVHKETSKQPFNEITSAETIKQSDEVTIGETVKYDEATTPSVLEASEKDTTKSDVSTEDIVKQTEITTEILLEVITSSSKPYYNEEVNTTEENILTTQSSLALTTSTKAIEPTVEVSEDVTLKEEKEFTTELPLEVPTQAESAGPPDHDNLDKTTKDKETATEPSLETLTSTEGTKLLVEVTSSSTMQQKEATTEAALETSSHALASDTPDETDEEHAIKDKDITTESSLLSSISDKVTESLELPTTLETGGIDEIISTTEKTSILETTSIDNKENEVEDFARIPGEGDCLVNSLTYRNNSDVPSTNNCHTSCRCISSIVKCDPIICSPPPEYMDNCQPTYDSPDSCCPTYICHSGETMPPQPDSHMSGTEKPVTSSTLECNGDQCIVKQDEKSPAPSAKPAVSECGPTGCGDDAQGYPHVTDTDKISTDCDGNECLPSTEVCTNGNCQGALPAKPCEGEKCDKPAVSECGPSGCSDDAQGYPHVSDTDKISTDCDGNECLPSTEVCTNGNCQGALPAKPCEGEKCDKPAVSECGPSGCSDDAQGYTHVPDTDKISTDCDGNECLPSTEVCTNGNCQGALPAKPCEGEKCDKPAVSECGPSGCSDDAQGYPHVPDTDKISTNCDGNECLPSTEVCTNGNCQGVLPAKPCEGEKCDIEPVIIPVKNIPLCENENDCKSQVVPCEGNECVKVDCNTSDCGATAVSPSIEYEQKPETCTDKDNCQKQEDEAKLPCSDDSCRRKETEVLENQLPIDCSGSDCEKQKPDVIEKVDIQTEIPIKVPEIVTETIPEEPSSKYPQPAEESPVEKYGETPSSETHSTTIMESSEQSTPKSDLVDESFSIDTSTMPETLGSSITTEPSLTTESEKIMHSEPTPQSVDITTSVHPSVTESQLPKETTQTEEEFMKPTVASPEISDQTSEVPEEHTSTKPSDEPLAVDESIVTDKPVATQLPEASEIPTELQKTSVTESQPTTVSRLDVETVTLGETKPEAITEGPSITTKVTDKKILELPEYPTTEPQQDIRTTEATTVYKTEEVTIKMQEEEKEAVTAATIQESDKSTTKPEVSMAETTESSTQSKETDIQQETQTSAYEPSDESSSTILHDTVDLTTTESPQRIDTDKTEFNEIADKTTSIPEKPKITESEYDITPTEATKIDQSTAHEDIESTSKPELPDILNTTPAIQKEETKAPFTNKPSVPYEDKTKVPDMPEENIVTLKPEIDATEKQEESDIPVTILYETVTASKEILPPKQDDMGTKSDSIVTDEPVKETETTKSEVTSEVATESSTSKQDVQTESSPAATTTSAAEKTSSISQALSTESDIESTKSPKQDQVTDMPVQSSSTYEPNKEETTEKESVSEIPEKYTTFIDKIVTGKPLSETTDFEPAVTESSTSELMKESTEPQFTSVPEEVKPTEQTDQLPQATDKIKEEEDIPSERPGLSQQEETFTSIQMPEEPFKTTPVPKFTQESATGIGQQDQTTTTEYHQEKEGPTEPSVQTYTEPQKVEEKTPSIDKVTPSSEEPATELQPVDYSVTESEPSTGIPGQFVTKGTTASEKLFTTEGSELLHTTKSDELFTKLYPEEETLTEIPVIVTEQQKDTETDKSELGPKIKEQETKEPGPTTIAPLVTDAESKLTQPAVTSFESSKGTESSVTESTVSLSTNIPESHIKDVEQTLTVTTFTNVPTNALQEEQTQTPHPTVSELQTEELLEVTDKPQSLFTEEPQAITTLSVPGTTEDIHKEIVTDSLIEVTTASILEEASRLPQNKVTEKTDEMLTKAPQDMATEVPQVEITTKLTDGTSVELQTETEAAVKETSTEKLQEPSVTDTMIDIEKSTLKSDEPVTETNEDVITKATQETSEEEFKTTHSPIDLTTKSEILREGDVTKEPETSATPITQEKTTIAAGETITEVQPTVITTLPETIDTKHDETSETLPGLSTNLPEEMITVNVPDTEASTKIAETSTKLPDDEITKPEVKETSEPKYDITETTPYVVELEEHTHKAAEETSTMVPDDLEAVTKPTESYVEMSTEKESATVEVEPTGHEKDQSTSSLPVDDVSKLSDEDSEKSTPSLSPTDELTTQSTIAAGIPAEKQDEIPSTHTQPHDDVSSTSERETEIPLQTEKTPSTDLSPEITMPEEEILPATSKATTTKIEEDITTSSPVFKPEAKPSETLPPTATPETPKPGLNEVLPTDEMPEDDGHFPPSGGSSGYGQEPDYVEEDQAFGPGTCRYGGKVYVSAQQIPRDDPCDFCFCFRSDIICLQQSCPPPIHGCHEEPIQGFCCPRYECPVAMATSVNVTTTTTTTTTTVPPHFFPHAYKGAAQRRGCQIKGHTYKVGEVVRASSGPCLHCTCGGDGQMKCDPKACTPEPMLRQMIAAAVSAKRRR